MHNPAEFTSIACWEMLKEIRAALTTETEWMGTAEDMGLILESKLKHRFGAGRPKSRFDAGGGDVEQKLFDTAYLMVKEANRSIREKHPQQAVRFIDRALTAWTEPKEE